MFFFKNHKLYLLFIFLFLHACQLQEPTKKHGILFLENRSNQIKVNKHNKNDILQLIGTPHSKSINDESKWIYFERIFKKGEFHKLGQNVLKENNVLILSFNKYGILTEKNFLNKDDINKVEFSDNTTINDLAQTSFIERFLNSVKSKMYSNRK